MNFKALCLVGMISVFGINASPIDISQQNIVQHTVQIDAPDLIEVPQLNVVFVEIAPIVPPVANNNQVNDNQVAVNPMELNANQINGGQQNIAHDMAQFDVPDLIEVSQQNVVFNDIAPIIPPIANNNEVDLHLEQQQQEQMVIQGNNVNHQIDQQLLEIAPISIPTANTNPHLT